MVTHTTWILIADAGHTRVLETSGIGHKLRLLGDMIFTSDLPPEWALHTNRLARTFDSTGHARHAIAEQTDPRRKLKRAFAGQIRTTIEAKLSGGAFDRLVIVAPPQMLGDFRQQMSKKLSKHIAAEIANDLVKTPNERNREHLQEVVAI